MASMTRNSTPRLSTAKREQILDGARKMFFESGYEGASMNDIAKAAGVSKGTLYTHFKDKEDLFTVMIQAECEQVLARNFVFQTGADPEATLRMLGMGFLNSVLSYSAMAVYRALMSEARRLPHLGGLFMRAGPDTGAEALSAFLAEATREGKLNVPDPELAAHQFIALCDSTLLQRTHMGAQPPSAEKIAHHVASAVSVFMRGYAPAGPK
jgi:AcrR family transcriptional regulator